MQNPRDSVPGYLLLANIQTALQELATRYTQGPEGICGIDPVIVPQIEIPNALVYAFTAASGDVAYTAGLNGNLTVMTVPPDERWELHGGRIYRDSGDNEITLFSVIAPVEYQDDNQSGPLELIRLTTGKTEVYWPDVADRQTALRALDMGPVLMEPGTFIRTFVDGTGAAAGNLRAFLCVRKTKIVRQRGPALV